MFSSHMAIWTDSDLSLGPIRVLLLVDVSENFRFDFRSNVVVTMEHRI